MQPDQFLARNGLGGREKTTDLDVRGYVVDVSIVFSSSSDFFDFVLMTFLL